MVRVLVTRPEPGASRTAARLEAMGHMPVVLPLSRIEPLQLDIDTDNLRNRFSAVAITSANAVRHADTAIRRALSGIPCYAVGPQTANAAAAAGFTISGTAPDAQRLAKKIEDETSISGRVAYLCGRMRMPAFEATLEKGGRIVQPLETYDTLSVSYTTDFLIGRFDELPFEVVLIHSAMAAEQFLVLMQTHRIENFFSNSKIYAISPRAAAGVAERITQKTIAATEPTEDALLSLLSLLSRN